MILDIFYYLFNRFTITLYALAMLLIVGAFATAKAIDPSSTLAIVLESTGYAIVAATLVASVVNFRYETSINNAFATVKGAEAARVTRIFSNRNAAMEDILRAMREARDCIDIVTVAGTTAAHLNGKMIQIVERVCSGERAVPARIQLLDPRSRYAIERSLREENEDFPPKNPAAFAYSSSTLCANTIESLSELENLLKDARCAVSVRLYNSPPMVWYVRVDNRAFVEQYHYGVPADQIKSHLTRCLGKSVPILEFEVDSKLGAVYSSHFDYVWERAATRNVRLGTKQKVLQDLEKTDWTALYTRESHDEDARLDLP